MGIFDIFSKKPTSTNTHSSTSSSNVRKEFEEKTATYFILSEAMRQGQQAGHKMPDEKFWLWLKSEIGDEVCDITKDTMNHINKNFMHGEAVDEMQKMTLAEWDHFANSLIKVIQDETL